MKKIKEIFTNPVNIACWCGLNILFVVMLLKRHEVILRVIGVVIWALSFIGYGYALSKYEGEKKKNKNNLPSE